MELMAAKRPSRYTLAELRTAYGREGPPLRQTELAQLADISQTYVSMLEIGQRKPSPYLEVRLAEVLGVTREQIRAAVAETLRRRKNRQPQIREN